MLEYLNFREIREEGEIQRPVGIYKGVGYGGDPQNKCVQVPVFRDKLCTSKQYTTFVEATYHNEWGFGLNRDSTYNTKPDH